MTEDAEREHPELTAIFREEPLRHHAAGQRFTGGLLRTGPPQNRWVARLVLGLAALALIIGSAIPVADYALAPALVRVEGGSLPVVSARLPARHRPHVEPGRLVRLALADAPYTYQDLPIAAVSDPEDGEELEVLLLLPTPTFKAGGKEHAFRDGMQGVAAVQVGRRPALFALLPGLMRLRGGDRHE